MDKPVPGYRLLLLFHSVSVNFGIGRAARGAGLSQPAISIAIKKLETILGCALLRRGVRGSEVTAEGELLLRRTARMIGLVEQGLAQILNLDVSSRGVRTACRRLTDSQIRVHGAILNAQSAAGAAFALGVSQVAVHRAGHALEQAVGIALYRRNGAKLVVNSAGVALGRFLQLAMNEVAQAVDELQSISGRLQGRLRVGVLPLSPQYFLAAVLSRMAGTYPDSKIAVQEHDYLKLQNDLRNGQIDVIFGALRVPRVGQDLVEVDLFFDPYEVVVRKAHKLAGQIRVTADDILRYGWIVPPQNTPRHQISQALFLKLQKEPPQVVETNSLAMIIALLQTGDLITILSRTQIHQSGFTDELARLAFELPDSDRMIGLITRKGWLPTELQSRFLSAMKAALPPKH